MIKQDEALKVALKANPEMKAIGVADYEKIYCVNLVPKINGEGFANGMSYGVYKDNGEHGWVNYTHTEGMKLLNYTDLT